MRDLASEPAIYGVVLVAGLVVVVGDSVETSWDVLAKVAATVAVFWAAHVYAGTVAHVGDEVDATVPLGSRVLRAGRVAVAHSWGLLLATLVPVVTLVLGYTPLLDDEQAIWAALWLSVVVLGVLGYAKVAPLTPNPWVRLAGGAATSALGLVLVLLKARVY